MTVKLSLRSSSQVYASGTVSNADPFFIGFADPVIQSIAGTSGVAVAPAPNVDLGQVFVTAATNGTSRVRATGTNFGTRESYLQLSNGKKFTDCVRNTSWIECTAPAGVSACHCLQGGCPCVATAFSVAVVDCIAVTSSVRVRVCVSSAHASTLADVLPCLV
jgi:hypothetical protein